MTGRIAVIHYSMDMYGGAEKVVVSLSKLRWRGFETFIVTCRFNPVFFEDLRSLVVEAGCPIGRKRVFAAYTALLNSRYLLRTGLSLKADLYVLSTNYYLAQSLPRTLIYAHFPEEYTVTGFIRKIMHKPLDYMEARGFHSTDVIIANSRFTASIIRKRYGRGAVVVYPGIDPGKYIVKPGDGNYLLVVSRYDPYKNMELAIKAYSLLEEDVRRRYPLVLAGTYNPRFPWYPVRLAGLADKLGVRSNVRFLFNVPEDKMLRLYAYSKLVLYPPVSEHFGIVPLEAMASGKPVLACPGGPAETIIDNVTGFVLEPNPHVWADKMKTLIMDEELAVKMGIAGVSHVRKHYSENVFVEKMSRIIRLVV